MAKIYWIIVTCAVFMGTTLVFNIYEYSTLYAVHATDPFSLFQDFKYKLLWQQQKLKQQEQQLDDQSLTQRWYNPHPYPQPPYSSYANGPSKPSSPAAIQQPQYVIPPHIVPTAVLADTTSPPAATVDKFRITELQPTIPGGREWFSKWDNGIPRTLGNQIDPYDKQFDTSDGDGKYVIDGKGTAIVSGSYPRMYVVDPQRLQKWGNVEITFYGKRISETQSISWAGLQAYARTDHTNDTDICADRGYGAQMLYPGEMLFEKEVNHHTNNGYPKTTAITPWPNGGPMPKNVWIGFKYIVRNVDNGAHVKLELYRDLTDGANGGTWTKMIDYTDTGGWGDTSSPCAPGVDPSAILTQPNVSVYIRNDGIGEVDYKEFSVREIAALP